MTDDPVTTTAAKAKHYPVTVRFTWPALILSGLCALAGAYFIVAWIVVVVLYAAR